MSTTVKRWVPMSPVRRVRRDGVSLSATRMLVPNAYKCGEMVSMSPVERWCFRLSDAWRSVPNVYMVFSMLSVKRRVFSVSNVRRMVSGVYNVQCAEVVFSMRWCEEL
jgi:hypothetical protein